ncbi:aspartyl protease family protein [Terricaulis sp.]|uniref:aspartyl protease family protein n=1 Tax=Terricaulis sp. TaxID=2768686 RepID=UPI00378504B5
MHRRTLITALALSPLLAATRAFAATGSTPLSYDARGRPLAGVRINDAATFPLVIDTAAGGTLLSTATIGALALQPTGRRARMQGASGAVEADLYNLDSVEIAGVRRRDLIAVQTPDNSASAAEHAGVLGAGVFAGARLRFDFAGGQLVVDAAPNRAPLAGAIDVNFRRIFAFAPVRIGGVDATAVIDTGARRTVGNAGLRQALGFADNDPRLREAEAVGGATADRTPAVAAEVTPLVFAGHDYGALDLAFSDLPVFAPLQLTGRPAVILGMDVFRRADALTLDYTSNQVALSP